MRFGDPGNPVKEECKWRNTNLLSSPVVFWGQRGWVLGLQFRDWRVGGGQNHHTGLNGGHIRDGGSHRVDAGYPLLRTLRTFRFAMGSLLGPLGCGGHGPHRTTGGRTQAGTHDVCGREIRTVGL